MSGNTRPCEDKGTRHPRWDKRETLTLVKAKRMKNENEENSAMRNRKFGSLAHKWEDISEYLQSNRVNRTPSECKKQWRNMMIGDYKKIRLWQKLHGVESYWNMSKDKRKERQLPVTFYREVYAEIEGFLARKPSLVETDVAATGYASVGERSDLAEGKLGQNEAHESTVRFTGFCGGDELISSVKSDVLPIGRNKRKDAPTTCDHHTFKQELASVLQNSGRALQEALSDKIRSQIEADNRNSELDRSQRKEQGDRLIGVLGSLAQALGRMADKM